MDTCYSTRYLSILVRTRYLVLQQIPVNTRHVLGTLAGTWNTDDDAAADHSDDDKDGAGG